MSAPTPDPDQMLSYRQAGELLGVSSDSVRRWVTQGRLPAYRLSRQVVRIKRKDLDAVLVPVQSGRVGEAL